MKKTFYIFSFIFLSVIFYGCDKEPVDEVVTDDYIKGEAIVRFDLNGVTYGARANEVKSISNSNGGLTIAVNAKDENNDFNRIYFSLTISSTGKGVYPWDIYSNSEIYSIALVKYAEEG